MAASSEATGRHVIGWGVLAAMVILGGWAFPPFHIVRLAPATPGAAGTLRSGMAQPAAAAGPADTTASAAKGLSANAAAFDAKATAAKVWHDQIPAAAGKAPEVDAVVTAVRKDPAAAKTRYGKAADLGSAYFFVRGRGRVTARERNQLVVALDGAPGEVIALRIGPVFGNTVRDGCGLLDVNSFPGLAEFNALAAELNALVEQRVLPDLRTKAQVGATVSFAGCAEAPEFAADPGEPVLTIVPVEAELP